MAFTLPELPYPKDALAPHISAETLDFHHGKKKVLAFLKDYYLEKYGYLVLGTYGIELDEKGESLFFYVDGRFTPPDKFNFGERRTGMFHVKIPASERVE